MTTPARLRRVVGLVLPPLVLGALIIAAWETWVNVRDVQPFIIPKPSAIWRQFVDSQSFVRDASWVTGLNAVVGLVIGSAFGFLLAVLTNRFDIVSQLVNPLAVTTAIETTNCIT